MRLALKIPPPVVALAVMAMMWSIASYPPSLPMVINMNHIPTITLVIIAVLFDFLALLAFRRSRTSINPLNPNATSTLVTTGIYRITRNPMYVGLALLLLAWAVHLAALWPFLGPILFIIYIHYFQILPEERVMADKFNQQYNIYTAQVRRWL